MAVNVEVIHGDCLAEIQKLRDRKIIVDAVCCDPPYHLLPTQQRFGGPHSAPAKHGRDGAMARLSSGFMNSRWDGGDIAFRPETWSEIATIMRPGAFLAAFGGCRTYHRLTCAIEDAGFIIQDCLMFMFATGFPKRRDMLKPAFEPIVLAYKPGGKRTMQIDECRIAAETIRTVQTPSQNAGTIYGADQRTRVEFVNDRGRWPANCVHDGSDEVLAAFPVAKGAYVNDASAAFKLAERKPTTRRGVTGFDDGKPCSTLYTDAGSAARFFFSAKAGAQDRWGSRHPTVKPVDLIRWLVKLVVPPGGRFLDPFAGSGTAGVAALAEGRDAILIERDPTYIADIRERMAFYEGGGTHSMQAKNRSRKSTAGPLFDPPALEAAE